MAIIILSGGKSSRMGDVDKQFLPLLNGKPMLTYIIDKLAELSAEIIIVDRDIDKYIQYSRLRVVADIYDAGPLAGIHAGLVNSDDDYNFVMGCDMPLVNVKLVKYMLARAENDVLVPEIDDYLEPLHAIYHKNCLTSIETVIKKGKKRVVSFYSQVEVDYLRQTEIRKFDPELESFININTRSDYRKIMKRLERG